MNWSIDALSDDLRSLRFGRLHKNEMIYLRSLSMTYGDEEATHDVTRMANSSIMQREKSIFIVGVVNQCVG
jgi:hypothetical protein